MSGSKEKEETDREKELKIYHLEKNRLLLDQRASSVHSPEFSPLF
jgi:hypothetical protein